MIASESTSLFHEFEKNSFVTKEVLSIVLQFSSQDPSLEEEQAKMAEEQVFAPINPMFQNDQEEE